MIVTYYEVIDKSGKIRFQALKQIDAEFYARHLIVEFGEEKPDIFAVEHEAVGWDK